MEKGFHWLARFIIARAKKYPYTPLRHADGSEYMDRFWWMPRWALRRRNDGTYERRGWVPFAFRVHHTMSSDWDRALHDHPWNSFSLILSGSYTEITPFRQDQPADFDQLAGFTRRDVRQAGDFVRRKAADRHRLEVAPGTSCWSLFWMGRKRREWGFHTNLGWFHYLSYLEHPESMA